MPYRSHLSRHKVKEIIAAKLGSRSPKEVTDQTAIVVGSLAKLFCGELIGTGDEHFYYSLIHTYNSFIS